MGWRFNSSASLIASHEFVVDCLWIVTSWRRRAPGSSGAEDRLLETRRQRPAATQRSAASDFRVVDGRPSGCVSRGSQSPGSPRGWTVGRHEYQRGRVDNCGSFEAGDLCRHVEGAIKPRCRTPVYQWARLERGSYSKPSIGPCACSLYFWFVTYSNL